MHTHHFRFSLKSSQKQTWTLKSDIISRVIYLQLTVPPLLEKQQTDVTFVLYKQMLRVSSLGRSTL